MDRNEVISTFIEDIKGILAEHTTDEAQLERVAERMQTLIRDPLIRAWREEPGGNIHIGETPAAPLYQESDGLTLMHASFGPEAMTPIHNHNSWGIVGVYRGRDRYQRWRRVDPENDQGNERVELIEERILEPGDVIIFPPPPQDIHAQQGYDGETAYELVLFGNNPMGKARLYFQAGQ